MNDFSRTKLGRQQIWDTLNNNKDQIIDLYINQKKTLKEVGKILNLNYQMMHKFLNRIGIKTRSPYSKNKYAIDNSYFEHINSNDRAYWLGWLMSDGNLSEKKNGIMLGVTVADKEILEKFKKYLKSAAPVHTYVRKNEKRPNWKDFSSFSFIDKKIANDLKKFGMKARKSLTLEFPKIDDKFFIPFMRGYFDGDGWIYMTKYKNGVCRFTAGFMSTKEFLEVALKRFEGLGFTFNVRRSSSKNENINMFSAILCDKEDVLQLFELLYKDCDDLFLKRKMDKFLELKEFFRLNPHKTVHVKKRPRKIDFT